ncbi:MAG: hypothetical protein IPO23_13395 [Flavobacterium sp.]|nr:hypothetical protein [Flavobacterium sp.]
MSQEATKQETMDWIASKLQNILLNNLKGPIIGLSTDNFIRMQMGNSYTKEIMKATMKKIAD